MIAIALRPEQIRRLFNRQPVSRGQCQRCEQCFGLAQAPLWVRNAPPVHRNPELAEQVDEKAERGSLRGHAALS